MSFDLVRARVSAKASAHAVHLSGDLMDCQIDMEEFCQLVCYVLGNSDLLSGDPRNRLMDALSNATSVDGWNEGKVRIDIPGWQADILGGG